MIRAFTLATALILGAATTVPASAADGIIDEVVIGVLDHDVDLIASGHEDGFAINGEVRFTSPELLDIIWSPRPTLGVTYATDNPGTDTAYGGLTWTIDLWGGFYTDLFFGLSVHNGNDDFDHKAALSAGTITNDSNFEKFVGCSVLFREAVEVGYRFGAQENHAISAMVSHLSHGQMLCSESRNAGMDHYGVRYGYKF
jgi:lipid A 3-O-deacylase